MALNKTLKQALWILPLVLIGGTIVTYAASPSLRGKLSVWLWSGKKTLRCSGRDVIVIRGKTAHAQHQVIYASGRCQVKIIDSELTGNMAVYASQSARITLKNAKLTAKGYALYLGDSAQATVEGSTLVSKGTGIFLGTGARVSIVKSKVDAVRQALYVGTGARAVVRDSQLAASSYDAIFVSSKGTLTMSGGTLTGRSAVHTGDGALATLDKVKVTVRERGFYVGGRSRLTLQSCQLRGAKEGIHVGAAAWLRASGTDLIVTGRTLYVSDDSDVEVRRARLKGADGVYASNRAKVRFEQVDLRSNSQSLYVSNRATVIFDRGKIVSAGRAIYASNNANITLKSVQVVGDIYKSGDAVITRVGEGSSADAAARRAAELAQRLKRYEAAACQGVLTCYQKHRQWGRVDVAVQVDVADDGTASKSTVRLNRRVKPAVRRCLDANAKTRRLRAFTGPRGTLSCHVTGNVQDGVQQLSYQRRYTPDPAALNQARSGALPDVE